MKMRIKPTEMRGRPNDVDRAKNASSSKVDPHETGQGQASDWSLTPTSDEFKLCFFCTANPAGRFLGVHRPKRAPVEITGNRSRASDLYVFKSLADI